MSEPPSMALIFLEEWPGVPGRTRSVPPTMSQIFLEEWPSVTDMPTVTLLLTEAWPCFTPPVFYQRIVGGQGSMRIGLRVIGKPPVLKIISGLIFEEPWSE